MLKRLRGEEGQDLIEYGVLATLIAVFGMAAVRLLGDRINLLWAPIAPNI
jgi:Flp pilus assembly pilin Flp